MTAFDNHANPRIVISTAKNIFPKELLGSILVKRGVIDQGQLSQALATQENKGGLLGEILVRQGAAQELDVVVALVVQAAVPYIAIDEYAPNPQVLRIIPVHLAREWRLVPLDRVGEVLSVVMADPLNEERLAELREFCRCKIAPFIATPSAIDRAIARWYENVPL